MTGSSVVTTAAELLDAVASGCEEISVRGVVEGLPMLTLGPGVRLRGGTLRFGAKGLRLTSDNDLEGVTVLTADDEVAILNDASVADLGTLSLRDVRTNGQVLLMAAGAVRAGHVRVEGLHVDRADLRGRFDRPPAVGVETLPGAFTLWNRQPDASAVITAELLDVGAGNAESPVRGSGVFVGGAVHVSALRTTAVHTDGAIPPGTPDLISGGVAVGAGAVVREVVNAGPVTTRGQNDMVLDNLGDVGSWTALAPLTSHGPSGIGFVNFGDIDRLDVRAPIHTFGTGARGFNFYEGSLRHASFASIATHGAGAIGVQVSRPLDLLEVAGDLTTAGGEGQSLVRGVQVALKAIALSIKPGGAVGAIAVGGQVRTTGDDVVSVEIDGEVGRIDVAGGVVAAGQGGRHPRPRGRLGPRRPRGACRARACGGPHALGQSAGPIASTTVAGSRTSKRQRSPARTTYESPACSSTGGSSAMATINAPACT
jgi:hypothetical protein